MNTLTYTTRTTSARKILATATIYCLLGMLPSYSASAKPDLGYLNEVDSYLKQGETRSAIILLKNALQENPDDAIARHTLGKIYLSTSDLASARKELSKAYELNPESAEIRIDLAKVFLQTSELEKLEPLISDTAGWAPELIAEANTIQAQEEILYGDLEEAEKILSNITQSSQNHPEVIFTSALLKAAQQNIEGAEKYLDQLLSKDPGHLRALSLKGDIALAKEDYQLAVQIYTKVSEAQNTNLSIKIKLSRALVANNQLEKANSLLEEILIAAPQSPQANYLSATIALEREDYENTIRHAEATLLIVADHLESHYISAVAYYSLKRLDSAYDHINTVVQRIPNHSPSLKLKAALELKLGLTDDATSTLSTIDIETITTEDFELLVAAGLASLNSADLESSKRLLEQASSLNSEDERLHLAQADIAIREGDWEVAISELSKVPEEAPQSQSAKIVLIMSYINNRQLDRAIDAARNFSLIFPQSPHGYSLEGWAHMLKNDFDSAENALQQALTIEPGSPRASQLLAALAVTRNNDTAEARRLLEKVVEYHPDNLTSLLQLSAMALQAGEQQQAVRWLEQAVANNPEALRPHLMLSELYLIQNKPAQALSIVEKHLDFHPQNPSLLMLVGEAYRRAGQTEQAISTFKELSELIPDNLVPYYRLAGLYVESEQLALAREAVTNALSINPEHPGALYVNSRIALKSGDIKQAENIVQQLQALVPDNALLTELQAEVALATNQPIQAIELYREVLKNRDTSLIRTKLASALWEQAKRDEAIATLTEWLNEHPEDPQVMNSLAKFYLLDHQFDNARDQYDKLVRHGPKNAQIHNNLAWLLLKRGDVETALGHAQQARKLAPNSPEVMDTLGLVLLEKGNHRAAERLFSDAADQLPQNLDIQFHLAQANALAGDNEKAEIILTQILSPENSNTAFSYREAAKRLLSELKK